MDSTQAIQDLFDQDGLLDILLGVEEYFDNMDLYAYKNWIYGELVEGPIVSKYWVEITLKFDHDTFPDPSATMIFERQGTKIFVRADWEIFPIADPRSNADMQSVLGSNSASVRKPKDERKAIILYKFQIPRRLVNPESFDEYKLMASDFNSNTMQSKTDDPSNPEPEENQQDDSDDIQFDETTGGQ